MGVLRSVALSQLGPEAVRATPAPPLDTRKAPQRLADTICQHLEDGRFPFQRAADAAATHVRWPINALTGRPYASTNAINLAIALQTLPAATSADPRFVSFQGAVKAGWRVKTGAKAVAVSFEHVQRRKSVVSTDPDSGERTTQVKAFPHMMGVPVFHASQIEGIPPYTQAPRSGDELQSILSPIVAGLGIVVSHNLALNEGQEGYGRHGEHECIYIRDASQYPSLRAYAARLCSMVMTVAGKEVAGKVFVEGDPDKSEVKRSLREEVGRAMMALQLGVHVESDAPRKVAPYLDLIRQDRREAWVAFRDGERMANYLLSFHPGLKFAIEREEALREQEVAALRDGTSEALMVFDASAPDDDESHAPSP